MLQSAIRLAVPPKIGMNRGFVIADPGTVMGDEEGRAYLVSVEDLNDVVDHVLIRPFNVDAEADWVAG